MLCLIDNTSEKKVKKLTMVGGVMAYKISDECTMCGACASECPVDAISEGDDKYVIDADTCTDCGACAEVCPMEAIAQG